MRRARKAAPLIVTGLAVVLLGIFVAYLLQISSARQPSQVASGPQSQGPEDTNLDRQRTRDGKESTGSEKHQPRPQMPAQTIVVRIASETEATSRPGLGESVMELSPELAVGGGPSILPVLDSAPRQGRIYYKVMLPAKAEETLVGWIPASATDQESNSWSVWVSRQKRKVVFFKAGRPVKSVKAVIGAPGTPTPIGDFFIEEAIPQTEDSPAYPWAILINVYGEISGTPAPVAFHGRSNLPGVALGQAGSAGCIRLDDADIDWMADHVRPGAPVLID